MGEFSLTDRDHPYSETPGKLAASFLNTGYLRVYGFSVYSSLAASQYIQMFDASTLPADTAVPIMTFNVGGTSVLGVYFGRMGRLFRRGIVLCNSTTDATKTIGAANCLWDVEYDVLTTPPSASSPDSSTA